MTASTHKLAATGHFPGLLIVRSGFFRQNQNAPTASSTAVCTNPAFSCGMISSTKTTIPTPPNRNRTRSCTQSIAPFFHSTSFQKTSIFSFANLPKSCFPYCILMIECGHGHLVSLRILLKTNTRSSSSSFFSSSIADCSRAGFSAVSSKN